PARPFAAHRRPPGATSPVASFRKVGRAREVWVDAQPDRAHLRADARGRRCGGALIQINAGEQCEGVPATLWGITGAKSAVRGNNLRTGQGNSKENALMSLLSVLDRERTVAKPGFSRWMVPPAALCVHLCIGQAYAFSVFNLPMTKLLGISQSAPGD